MRQLLLLRHAKSSRDDKLLPDRDRPLAPKGRVRAAAMAQTLRELGLAPDLVLVSPARRTLETLEALEPWDETPLIEPLEQLYLANVTQLFTILNGVAETVRSVLLIGHNPGLHELAVALCDTGGKPPQIAAMQQLRDAFPTAALAEFAIAGPWWQLHPGAARLVRYLTVSDAAENS